MGASDAAGSGQAGGHYPGIIKFMKADFGDVAPLPPRIREQVAEFRRRIQRDEGAAHPDAKSAESEIHRIEARIRAARERKRLEFERWVSGFHRRHKRTRGRGQFRRGDGAHRDASRSTSPSQDESEPSPSSDTARAHEGRRQIDDKLDRASEKRDLILATRVQRAAATARRRLAFPSKDRKSLDKPGDATAPAQGRSSLDDRLAMATTRRMREQLPPEQRAEVAREHRLLRRAQRAWRELKARGRTTRGLCKRFLGLRLLDIDAAVADTDAPVGSSPSSPGHADAATHRARSVAATEEATTDDDVASLASSMEQRRSFDELARKLRGPQTLAATTALLARVQQRAAIVVPALGSDTDPVQRALHALAPPPKQRRPGAPARPPAPQARYPARLLLSTFMMMEHPEVVLNAARGNDPLEAEMLEAVKSLHCALAKLLRHYVPAGEEPEDAGTPGAVEIPGASPSPAVGDLGLIAPSKLLSRFRSSQRGTEDGDAGDAPTLRQLLCEFDSAWGRYLTCFVAWKRGDAKKLVHDMVLMASDLTASCALKLGADPRSVSADDLARAPIPPPADGEPSSPLAGRSPDVAAMISGWKEDVDMLRGRVVQLAGPAAGEEFDQAVSGAVDAGVAEAQRRAEARAAAEARRAAEERNGPPVSANAEMMWRILHDRGFKLPTEAAEAEWAAAAAGEPIAVPEATETNMQERVRLSAIRAFWEMVKGDIVLGVSGDDEGTARRVAGRLAALIAELGQDATEVASGQNVGFQSAEDLIPGLLTAAKGRISLNALAAAIGAAATCLRRLISPARDAEYDAALQRMQATLSQAREQLGSSGANEAAAQGAASATVQALRALRAQVQLLKLDGANAHLGMLAAASSLQEGSSGGAAVVYAKQHFAEPLWSGDDAKATERTRAMMKAGVGTAGALLERAAQVNDAPLSLDSLPEVKAEPVGVITALPTAPVDDWRLFARVGVVAHVTKEQSDAAVVPEVLRMDAEVLRGVREKYARLERTVVALLAAQRVAAGRQVGVAEAAAAQFNVADRVMAYLSDSPDAADVDLARLVVAVAPGQAAAGVDEVQAASDLMGRLRSDSMVRAVSDNVRAALAAVVAAGLDLSGASLPDSLREVPMELRSGVRGPGVGGSAAQPRTVLSQAQREATHKAVTAAAGLLERVKSSALLRPLLEVSYLVGKVCAVVEAVHADGLARLVSEVRDDAGRE
ncbi:unnamed protein product [Pedinophyceae sp. YPF-701]|nr:unnamed protein product [Pedinophyceae sp. YPF-701]